LSQENHSNEASNIEAENTSVSKKTVVRGLGYPNGREEVSPDPVGWQANSEEITMIEKQVSRETSR
jgi:hypothetical protein